MFLSVSIALATARARSTRSAAGCSINDARSSRCRARAKLASFRRMSPRIAREDCPVTLLWPRYCTTAARAGMPAYQARSAASCEALGKPLLPAASPALLTRLFMPFRLSDQSLYRDKKTYRDRFIC